MENKLLMVTFNNGETEYVNKVLLLPFSLNFFSLWPPCILPVSSPCPSAMTPIPQDKRVSMGLNGDLYFSNVLAKDAHTDYSCNARFLFTHTIQQKNPFTLKVLTSK